MTPAAPAAVSETVAQGGIFADAYTRLLITSDVGGQAGDAEQLAYRDRGPLARFLVAKQAATNLTAAVSAGPFRATVPLITLDHRSDTRVGEQWARTIYHRANDFPLFLVGAGGESSIPTIRISLTSSIEYNSRLIATAVDAALTIARDVAPEAAVVTELSKPSIQRQARAVDAAVSKLFGIDIEERHWQDDEIRFWNRRKGTTVSLRLPADENGYDTAGARMVGQWRITFAEPRPSLFVDWHICPDRLAAGTTEDKMLRCTTDRENAIRAVYRDVDEAAVLRTPLTNGDNGLGQIGNYLAQQSWYKSAVLGLSGAQSSAAARPIATEFCRHIRDTIRGVGLSSVDSGIVVWAVVTGMPDLPARGALRQADICKAWVDLVNASRAPQDRR